MLVNRSVRKSYHIFQEARRLHLLQRAPAFDPASWTTGITTLSGNQKIYICGLPKSGNVWCRRLIADSLDLPTLQANPEFDKCGVTGWHRPWHFLMSKRKDIFRCFYLIRDIRDVIVSYYYYSKTEAYRNHVDKSVPDFDSIEDFYTNYFLKTVVPYYSWSKHPDPYIHHGAILIKYEELKSNALETVTNMLTQAGFKIQHDKIVHAVNANSFNQLKKEGAKLSYRTMPQSHFRKGIVGDYRNEMSQTLIRRISIDFGDFMSKWGYA